MRDKNRLGKHHIPRGGRIKGSQRRGGQRGERDPVDRLITKFLERGGRDGNSKEQSGETCSNRD